MKKRSLPSSHTILMLIAALVCILSWIIPAGQFDSLSYDSNLDQFIRISNNQKEYLPAADSTLSTLGVKIPIEKFTQGDIYKPIGIPGTYQKLDAQPQGLIALIQAPIKGIIEAADIIFLVLIIGGLIGIINLTGAFDAGIKRLSEKLQGKEYVLIIVVTFLVALGGTTFGLGEETIAFLPILAPVFLAARYDTMVTAASIFLGSSIGIMCSTVNPFATIIASDSAGINWTAGLESRLISFVIMVGVTIAYILRYASVIRKSPERSFVYEQNKENQLRFGLKSEQHIVAFTPRLMLILAIFLSSFVLMVYGITQLDWWFLEMTSLFLATSILIGLLAQINEKDFINSFINGASDLLSVAFIIGIARGVSIIMSDGQISDTLLNAASTYTAGLNKAVFINASFLSFGGLSFFISSSSGLAVLSMPILSPLADSVGIGREWVVNAYQFASGLFYLISPTGLLLPTLAVVKIPFNKWLKFIMPLFLILILLTMINLTITVLIH